MEEMILDAANRNFAIYILVTYVKGDSCWGMTCFDRAGQGHARSVFGKKRSPTGTFLHN